MALHTIKANGPRIRELRLIQGWSLLDLEVCTSLKAEELAREDPRNGRSHGCGGRGSPGINGRGRSLATLRRLERSQQAFPKTLRLLAATFGVDMVELIHPDDPFFKK